MSETEEDDEQGVEIDAENFFVNALRVKAYKEWVASFSHLEEAFAEIAAAPESEIAKDLLYCAQNWGTCGMQRIINLSLDLVHHVSPFYQIEPPRVMRRSQWEEFERDYTMDEISNQDHVYAFYVSKSSGLECIVLWDEEGIQKNSFEDMLRTVFHELAHAIIDIRAAKLYGEIEGMLDHSKYYPIKKINDNDVMDDPLATVLCFHLQREFSGCKEYDEKADILKDTTMSDQEKGMKYFLFLEERLALEMEEKVSACLEKTLETIEKHNHDTK